MKPIPISLDLSDSEGRKTISFGDIDKYQIVYRVGRGKYSTVFSGISIDTQRKCIIKVLKPVRSTKIYKEIQILTNLRGKPNISELIDVVHDNESDSISLILEWVNNTDFRTMVQHSDIQDIKWYIYGTLQALSSAHHAHIMHRDIKPGNIMADLSTHSLRLIDWGLADFYDPTKQYPTRVATRNYKSPELLLGNTHYDYSLDIWSLGCTFASLIFRRLPFFRGHDNDELLLKIVEVFGSDPILNCIEKYKIQIQPELLSKISGKTGKGIESFISESKTPLVTPEALTLLKKMLQIDYKLRITADEALADPFFDSVRNISSIHVE